MRCGARAGAATPPLLLLLLLLLGPGCGHRGAPTPPAPSLPAVPRAPLFRQRGPLLEVSASYTVTRLGGRRLDPPVAPALLFAVPRAAGDLTGWETPAREREFVRLAAEWEFTPFDPAEFGTTVARRDAVGIERLGTPRAPGAGGRRRTAPPEGPPPDGSGAPPPVPPAVVLALALRDEDARSLPTTRGVLRPAVPPLPPVEGLTATTEETGIRLAWTAPADPGVTRVAVWRHRAAGPEPWSEWRTIEAGAGGTFDETAVYGDDFVYVVATARAAAAQATEVPVYSEPRQTGPVRFRDVFPPLPPSDLDAVPQTGSVRVFWFPGGSADEARARVEREVEGGDGFRPLVSVETPESYAEDRDVQPGRRYRYRVTVEDREGNVAEPVGPTGWVSPRPAEVPRR